MSNQDWKVERENRLKLGQRFALETLAISILARKAGMGDEATVKAIDKARGELFAGAAAAAEAAELKSVGAARKGATTARVSYDVKAVAMMEGFTLSLGRLVCACRAFEKASGFPARDAMLAALDCDSERVKLLVHSLKTF